VWQPRVRVRNRPLSNCVSHTPTQFYHKYTSERHISILRCEVTAAALGWLHRLHLTRQVLLAVGGFTHPCREAHLCAIFEDDVTLVVRTFRVIALVVGEEGEGVGLWCVVAHLVRVKRLKIRVFDWD
jgi:hypothetical protein